MAPKKMNPPMAGLTKKKLQTYVNKGMTDCMIGEMFGVTRQAVHQLRKRMGIASRTEVNEKRNAKMSAAYNRGWTVRRISEKFDVSISQTYRILHG